MKFLVSIGARASRPLLILLLAMWCAVGTQAMAAGPLEGRFYGIDGADGAELRVSRGDGAFAATIRDGDGGSRDFSLTPEGGGAAGMLRMDGRQVLMRLDPVEFGVEALIVPVAEGGKLITEQSQVFVFVRSDIDLPEMPEGFIAPPPPSQRVVPAYSFLSSYQFWSPAAVRDGYARLPTRHRTLIRLFPAVQLDVIWKLCLAEGAEVELGTATRGQGVSCDEVREVISRAQSEGRFGDYKAEVTEQSDTLITAVRCGDNFVESKRTCDEAAVNVSRMATSLETAANVLDRYR
ncbi:MAG: hypothetical protein AAFP67_03430 [Pseudomonadota bacterium]